MRDFSSGAPVVDRAPSDLEEPLHILDSVSYTHLRAHETVLDLVCRLLLEKKNIKKKKKTNNKKKKPRNDYQQSKHEKTRLDRRVSAQQRQTHSKTITYITIS